MRHLLEALCHPVMKYSCLFELNFFQCLMCTTAHSTFKDGNGIIIQLVENAGEFVGEIKMARTQGSTSLQFCKKRH